MVSTDKGIGTARAAAAPTSDHDVVATIEGEGKQLEMVGTLHSSRKRHPTLKEVQSEAGQGGISGLQEEGDIPRTRRAVRRWIPHSRCAVGNWSSWSIALTSINHLHEPHVACKHHTHSLFSTAQISSSLRNLEGVFTLKSTSQILIKHLFSRSSLQFP